MKSKKTIEKQMFDLSEEDRRNLQALAEDITNIIEKGKINETSVKKLTNVVNMLTSLKDNYLWRMLRAAKQNHMID